MPANSVAVEVVTPPTTEPVTLAETKLYLRVDFPDEDALITQLIQQARQHGEDLTKRSLAPQTLRAVIEPGTAPSGTLSGPIIDTPFPFSPFELAIFPFGGPVFNLPNGPVTAIGKIEYQANLYSSWVELPALDTAGNATYKLDASTDPDRIVIVSPLVASRYRITYDAGYSSLPSALSMAIKSLVSHWYDNRQGEAIPEAITEAFTRRRVFEL